MSKIKLVIFNEHTLGYIVPGFCNDICYILHASILRGATKTEGFVLVTVCDNVRLASEKDFDAFRVSFEGYNNPEEYIYQS